MKLKRQGLQVTAGQLRRIADKLEKGFPVKGYCKNQILHLLSIINKEGLSDTWMIEE